MKIHVMIRDWIFSITIGILVVSYWRNSWTVLDILGCQQPSTATPTNGDSLCFILPTTIDPNSTKGQLRFQNATFSYGIGIVLLFIGVAFILNGYWLPSKKTMIITPQVGIRRFIIVYILGAAAVSIWRGIWYWLDYWVFPTRPFLSYWVTSIAGAGGTFMTFSGSSLLAPPAIFLLDGPDTDPPPIAITALNAYFSVVLESGKERPTYTKGVGILDLIFSFGFIPFAVVAFWRGSWGVLDYYLWGFTDSEKDIKFSLLESMIMFLVGISVTSESAIGRLDDYFENTFLLGMLGRVRNYILAWTTVSFWRCIWIGWDVFLGSSFLVAILGHGLSILALLFMGCMSSIVAPPSTIGVDGVPDPECEDEPLFSMVPVPWETLYAFGMFRQIDKTQKAFIPEEIDDTVSSDADELPSSSSTTTTGEIELGIVSTIDPSNRSDDDGRSKEIHDEDIDDDEFHVNVPEVAMGIVSTIDPSYRSDDDGGNEEIHDEDIDNDDEFRVNLPVEDDDEDNGSQPSRIITRPTRPSLTRLSFTMPTIPRLSLTRTRSWRPGPTRMEGSLGGLGAVDWVPLGLRHATVTPYAQRPTDDNIRLRSKLFTNRGTMTRR